MLKNLNVQKVNLNTDLGICRIYMENGDIYQSEDTYFPECLYDYIEMLRVEDGVRFTEKTIWTLLTDDDWMIWQGIFSKMNVSRVLFADANDVVQCMDLKGTESA